MSSLRASAHRLLGACTDIVKGAFGTDAYERYRAHHAAHHAASTPLDRAAFFRRRQSERWHGISRCC